MLHFVDLLRMGGEEIFRMIVSLCQSGGTKLLKQEPFRTQARSDGK
jgi:hypothetical protein